MKYQEVLKNCVLAVFVVWLAGNVQAQGEPQMTVLLAENGSLPADDPYCGRYPGAETTIRRSKVGAESGRGGCVPISLAAAPNFTGVADGKTVGVVDWILVEIRASDATEAEEFVGDTVTVQIPALLLSNGLVVDAERFAGSSSVLSDADRTLCATVGNGCDAADVEVPSEAFPVAVGTNVRVVIRHRNHLDVMSAVPVVETDGVRMFDFTTVTNVYTPLADIPAVWSYNSELRGDLERILSPYPDYAFLVPGDTNGNGVVEPVDVTGATGFTGAFVSGDTTGYNDADTSMNNVVAPDDVTERGFTTAFVSGAASSLVPN